MSTHDVLIVGAGPTGLCMAIELARRGISVRLIDKIKIPADKSKALFIQARTLELFDHTGIAHSILQKSLFLKGGTIHFTNKKVDLHFEALKSSFPFGVTLPQCETEEVLRGYVEQLGITIEYGLELVDLKQEEREVIVTLQNSEKKEQVKSYPWVIGADGAHSSVRHLLKTSFEGSQYIQTFALADVEISGDLEKERMNVFVTGVGIFVVFPLPGNLFRIIINDVSGKEGEELTLERMQTYVDSRKSNLKLKSPKWLSYFHINSRQASHYRENRVFLAGDAAHIHSPAGGLGMNTGIQDAYNLGWKLALVIKGESPDSLLNSYESERVPVAHDVLKFTEYFTKVMTSHSSLFNFLRKKIMPYVLKIPAFQKRFLTRISQINLNYRHSPITKDTQKARRKLHAGDRLPVILPIKNLLHPTKPTLFLFSDTQENNSLLHSCLTLKAVKHLHTHIISKKDTAIFEHFNCKKCALFLIRPDEYIGFASDSLDPKALEDYLSSLFIT
ncbi:MAG: FAD-dependent oxidoreductase [Chlamydiales bacterium]|nr:FAD-dependent oxidoreductase [Chlamydiales bacterium]